MAIENNLEFAFDITIHGLDGRQNELHSNVIILLTGMLIASRDNCNVNT